MWHEYGRRPLLWLIIKYVLWLIIKYVPCVPLCHVINLMWPCGYIFQCMTYVMVDIKDLLLYIFSFSFLPSFFIFIFHFCIFRFYKIITSTTLNPHPQTDNGRYPYRCSKFDPPLMYPCWSYIIFMSSYYFPPVFWTYCSFEISSNRCRLLFLLSTCRNAVKSFTIFSSQA